MIDEAFKEIMTNLKKTQEDVDRIRVDLNFEKEQRSKTYGRYMAEKDRNKKLQDKTVELNKILDEISENLHFRYSDTVLGRHGTELKNRLLKILEKLGE